MGITEEERRHSNLLRQRAEEALQGKLVELSGLSSDDILFLLHELQVHQTELGLQNEELRQMQQDLEASRDRYSNLYNFAPAGYCTIDRKDRILEANQTLAALLGIEQKQLTKHMLNHFVMPGDQDKYYLCRRWAFAKHLPQTCEIRLVKQSGEPVYTRLESMVANGDDNELMIMLIDISEQRELQRRLIEQREKERKKIARDLHDGPVQVLSAINFSLRGILMDHPDKELAQSLEAIQSNLREQIQTLRNFSVDLRSPILAHLGLEMAIRSYIESFGADHPDILFRMALHPILPQPSEEVGLALYRICQEALQNVAKHAQKTATEVVIQLYQENNYVRLEIRDNGDGFDLPADFFHFVQAGHLGLVGMRERAEAAGGHLEVQSSQGKGTLIKAVIPLNDSLLKKVTT